MKILLFSILLLVGCTREYTCDGNTYCLYETAELGREDGVDCDISITVNWPEGEKEAKEGCEEVFSSIYDLEDSLRYACVLSPGCDAGSTGTWVTVDDSSTVGLEFQWHADTSAYIPTNRNCTCEKAD